MSSGSAGRPGFVDDPKHWLERAAEARQVAQTLSDPVARRAMEEIAAAYARMAERAVRRKGWKNGGQTD